MNQCVHILFLLVVLILVTTTATNQLVAVGRGGGGDGNGVMKKCLDKERHALLHFKASLQDPIGCLYTWRAEENDCCRWKGVMCNNNKTGHVTGLNIRLCLLEGEISHSLVNLSYLNHLDLSANYFNGTIPTFIGSLTQLRYLDLSFNYFNGTIPTFIGSLTQLRYLDLSDNDFNGIIPGSIGSLTELRHLDLSYNSLYGTIPQEFGNLTNLQGISLGNVGRCRVENIQWLSHLSHLEDLRMDGISLAKQNYWVDVISSLRNLSHLSLDGCELSQVMYPYSSSFLNSSSSLYFLNLRNNNLTSSMYHWLFPLTSNKLQYLYLSNNMLDGIPKYFGNICSLTFLNLNNNSMAVEFSVFLSNLSGCTSLSLQYLHASQNQFTGPLSDDIQTLTNLTYLDISNNRISDTIPMDIWSMWPSQLTYLNLSSNNISGKAPDLSSHFDSNSVIDLSSNNFYGPMSNVSSTVASLDLSRNKFSGGISFICQIVGGFLEFLDLSGNFLSGPLPNCLWHFKRLVVLKLEDNNLSGRLPPSIGYLRELEVLDLYKNNFSGELPLSLKNCTSLNLMNLGANKFSGNVPVWIGEKLSRLYVLILRSNSFFGTIPLQLCQLPNLQILDMSKNHLNGTIPSCLSNLRSMIQGGKTYENVHFMLTSDHVVLNEYVDQAMIEWQGDEREFFRNLGLLRSIDLSSNNLTGQIPYAITNLYELISLNLSKNSLLGEIPLTIGQMKQLETLDLSRNNLSGEMPSSMSEMCLLNDLDVSFNNLSGRIPTSTQLQSFEPSRYNGNRRLCGPPLSKKCPGDEESEATSVNGKSEGDGEDIDEVWGWFYIGGATGFVTGFWIACGALLLNRQEGHVFFHFYDGFSDWVYVKVVVFIVNLQRVS
ncbi:receptor-like protein EIX2 [Lactuca sativa]|uniref:receptor-like protein EIX2 n=1 Tax=Lactuca sativa TaxID=4236 RepID=UPI000CD81A38|nr:receptor-like protein EIX2 [Lactuca sativa]